MTIDNFIINNYDYYDFTKFTPFFIYEYNIILLNIIFVLIKFVRMRFMAYTKLMSNFTTIN